jgi:hypothetical protein
MNVRLMNGFLLMNEFVASTFSWKLALPARAA